MFSLRRSMPVLGAALLLGACATVPFSFEKRDGASWVDDQETTLLAGAVTLEQVEAGDPRFLLVEVIELAEVNSASGQSAVYRA